MTASAFASAVAALADAVYGPASAYRHDRWRKLVGTAEFSLPEGLAFTSLRGIGMFLCTERDHGNDAARMETTATRDADGFVLHTPHPGAAKFMPNTGPAGGPKSALVAARLVMDGEDYGVHLFLTPLHDEAGPRPGVGVEELPEAFTGAVDHCATTFDRVRLPADALLGPEPAAKASGSGRRRLLRAINRVTTGKLCMSACGVGAAKLAVARAVAYAHTRRTAGMSAGSTVAGRLGTEQAGVLLDLLEDALVRLVPQARALARALG